MTASSSRAFSFFCAGNVWWYDIEQPRSKPIGQIRLPLHSASEAHVCRQPLEEPLGGHGCRHTLVASRASSGTPREAGAVTRRLAGAGERFGRSAASRENGGSTAPPRAGPALSSSVLSRPAPERRMEERDGDMGVSGWMGSRGSPRASPRASTARRVPGERVAASATGNDELCTP